MTIAHVTKTGNISIPSGWRKALQIAPNSNVVMELVNNKIIIEPIKKTLFKKIDDEIAAKNIRFTRKEAIKDDLY